MSLGGNSLFEDCHFDNVRIRSASLDGATFRNCVITGKLQCMIWLGAASPVPDFQMALDHCDLSDATFENINIYAGVDFSTTKLPVSSIRVFNNAADSFATALREAGASLDKDARIALDVLGQQHGDQNPVIFDLVTLDKMLDQDVTRRKFEEVAKEYEMTLRPDQSDS